MGKNEPAPADPNQPPANPDGNQPPAPAPAGPSPTDPPADPNKPAAPVPQDPNAKLQSERDKLKNKVTTLEEFLEPIVVERAVDKFLAEKKSEYPDLERDDLMHVTSPDELEAEAKRLQSRLNAHAQKKLMDIENPTIPTMTAAEREAEMDNLRKSKEPGRFQKYLKLKTSAT